MGSSWAVVVDDPLQGKIVMHYLPLVIVLYCDQHICSYSHTRFIVCKHVAVMVMVEIMVTWYYDLLYSLSGKIPLKVISASSMGRIHNSSFGRDATCTQEWHLMFGRCWPVARQKCSNPSHYILFTRHILPFDTIWKIFVHLQI